MSEYYKNTQREISGYQDFQDYLDHMKAYRFYPHFKTEEEWNARYIGVKERQQQEKLVFDIEVNEVSVGNPRHTHNARAIYKGEEYYSTFGNSKEQAKRNLIKEMTNTLKG